MSGVHIAPPELQPASFEFTPESMALAKKHIAKYPEGRQQSAVMPLLDIAQRQHDNWVPQAAIRYIAELLGMPAIRVLEVASFYTMYNLAPVGTHFVQVCTTTPCWLRGSDKVLSACRKHLGVGPGETTPDGKFTVIEVECLGACVNAPMLQLGDDFYEDLDEESTGRILEALKRGETPRPGPQNGRLSSEPKGGATTLTTFNPAAPAAGSDD
ncbi:NADH-quinone oxidoreductase subunit NuoE [Ferrovibrio sp.]|uniref:NADH-quinone oxidoreductase subunit NuoE n=1 Tax=Ferrovibrio sp. TaxID=1917215 RepID=UPI00260D1933|nr:NADH-quinone oxidoreductase subunit NuoE [Ferrovibrio sp.]